ncbi:MAG: hypothetical protein IKX58_08480 [Clostridia bacterium]|nr:hypothetical protein [Clostridia bacterium]
MRKQPQDEYLNYGMDSPIEMLKKIFRRIYRSDVSIMTISISKPFIWAITALVFIYCIPLTIILNWRYLGAWMWVLLGAYIVALMASACKIIKIRSMRLLRSLMGDEAYFKAFPNEYKRELKRIRRRERAAERRNFDRKA